jgi:hypothetical protein
MAQIYYDVWDTRDDDVKAVALDNRKLAMAAAKKKHHTWERMFLTHPTDYLEPAKHAGELFTANELIIFTNNEQNTYRFCPWGGTAKLVASDEKYEMYHTTNFEHSKKEGFYLVDNAPRLK